MIYLASYLSAGLGMYAMAWAFQPGAFKDHKLSDWLRGFSGVLIWPVMLYIVYASKRGKL